MRHLLVVFLLLAGCTQAPVEPGCAPSNWSENAPPVGAFALDMYAVSALFPEWNFDYELGEEERFIEARKDSGRFLVRDGIRGIELQLQHEDEFAAPGRSETTRQRDALFDLMQVDVDVVETFASDVKRRGWYQTWNENIIESTAGIMVAGPNGTTTLQMGSLRDLPQDLELVDAQVLGEAFVACSSEWQGDVTVTGMTVVNDSVSFAVLAKQGTECIVDRHFFIDAVTGAIASEELVCL